MCAFYLLKMKGRVRDSGVLLVWMGLQHWVEFVCSRIH